MAVRNFFVDAEIDGRETDLGGGPRSKTGGMDVTVYQRNEGQIETAVKVRCRETLGLLITQVYVDGKCVAEIKTKR